jgi:hypothetical protein
MSSSASTPRGFKPVNPCLVQEYSGPYIADNLQDAITLALDSIPVEVRIQTLPVHLIVAGKGMIFWLKDNVDELALLTDGHAHSNYTTLTRLSEELVDKWIKALPNVQEPGAVDSPHYVDFSEYNVHTCIVSEDSLFDLIAESITNGFGYTLLIRFIAPATVAFSKLFLGLSTLAGDANEEYVVFVSIINFIVWCRMCLLFRYHYCLPKY